MGEEPPAALPRPRDPAGTREALPGLYVHIPFCEAKCSYCHFAIDPRRPGDERQERYLRALLREMEEAPRVPADTLYFGGGTPSLLAAPRLALLLDAARRNFALPAGAEVTLEANPRDLDGPGYGELRALGVSRLSLGVQAFDDTVLHEMGRLHSAEDARIAVGLARAAGFHNLSIDMILGWPGENPARWRRALARLAELAPEHVSLYVLEVEGRTLLSHRARAGTLELPDADLVVDLYLETVEALARLGLSRYEISNFALPGFESRHNGKYWDDVPFLGFGMAAHSYRGDARSWNLDTYGAYCRGVEARGAAGARAGERALSLRERAAEALFTGLRRCEGIDPKGFEARYGLDPLREYGPALRDPLAAGLLAMRDGRLRLTDRGVLLSNEVFQAFV